MLPGPFNCYRRYIKAEYQLLQVDMAPTKAPSNSQGKQQTSISSFFTPKQATSSTPPSTAKRKAVPPIATPVPRKGNSTNDKTSVDKPQRGTEDVTDAGKGRRATTEEENGDDDIPIPSISRFSATRSSRTSEKRHLELSDDEDGQGSGDSEDEKITKSRKKARRSPSYQPPSRDEVEKGNEPQDEDVEMTDIIPKLLKTTSKFKSLAVTGSSRKSLKEATKEKTSQFAYQSSPGVKSSGTEVDPEYAKQKAKLREKFIQKLGKPNSIDEIARRKGGAGDEGEEAGEEEDAGEDPEEEEEEKPKRGKKAAAKGASGKKGKSKLTPLEKQVVDIKMQYPDTILVVEVGYKYRFFGEDARVASKELSIMCIPGKMRFDEHPSEAHLDKFASASIPVHRLHVHVKRLVSAGHKVGVVRQLETAALKAVGDNRNAPFTRKLTNLYTKGTYVDDVDGFDDVAGVGTSAPATGYLLCLTEKPAGGMGRDEKVNLGIIAVQPSTGDVIYDEFEDGLMRSEIETRLLHIAPCELLIVGELSKATEKLVTHLAGST